MSKEALYEPVPPASGLKVFSSPLKSAESNEHNDMEEESSALDYDRYPTEHRRHPDNYPQLQRHEEPTLLEIFYDLFFAATYNAYCEVKEVTNHASFKASIGFFCLLWLTWFNVTLFDVRYATDSIFSRLNTAIQLGVLIGFVVVAPKFNPTTQDVPAMRAMSVILAVSRFNLVGQYAWMTYHVRRFRPTRWPLIAQTLIHLAAGAVYLGLTFRFKEGATHRSHAFVSWYCVSGVESLAGLLLSNYSPIVSLGKTHLMKRLTLLTVMILGEGIESIAKKVLVIVKNKHAWDTTTIGFVTAAAATVYFVFLVYFDWLGAKTHLPPLRRNFWVALHLPFHLALVLFMQGFTQLLLWGKIAKQLERAFDLADPTDDTSIINSSTTSMSVAKAVSDSVGGFFDDFPPAFESTGDLVKEALKNITELPNTLWPLIANLKDDNETASWPQPDQEAGETLYTSCYNLALSMANSIFAAFDTEIGGEIEAKHSALEKNDSSGFQFQVQERGWRRYGLVFAYTYISAGCALLFVLILKQIADGRVGRGWSMLRQLIVLALALGTALTSTLWFSSVNVFNWLLTPWVLPTLAFVWLAVVIVTHINLGGVKLRASHLKWRSNA